MRENRTGNLVLPIVLLGLCALLYSLSLDFPRPEDDPGAAAVPHLWMLVTSFFCLVLVWQAARGNGDVDPTPGRVPAVLLFAGWMVIYLHAIEAIGYFASTFVFLPGAMFMMGYRRPLPATLVTLGWLVFSYLVFVKLLYIPLPIGLLLGPLLG